MEKNINILKQKKLKYNILIFKRININEIAFTNYFKLLLNLNLT